MFSESIEFRGFDALRWARLARLIDDEHRRPLPPGPPGVLLLRRGGRVVKALHTHRGRLPVAELSVMETLHETARAISARWVISVDLDAVEAVVEEAAATFQVGGDLLDLALALGAAAERERDAGRLEIWPDLFEGVKQPSREALDKVFDIILPPRTSAMVYLFDGQELAAEIICARGPKEIVLIGGHEALETGPPPRRWREDYRRLLEAAERTFGKPSLGVFMSLDSATALLQGRDELSGALARRDLILDPLPLWLAGPMGVVAVKSVVDVGLRAGAQIAERAKPSGLAGRLAGRVAGKVAGRVKRRLDDRLRQVEHVGERLRQAGAFDRVEQTVGKLRAKTDLNEILGFDPIVLGRRVGELLRSDEK